MQKSNKSKKTKKTEIKAVAFDIGGVLDIESWFYEKMCKDLGVNYPDFLKESTEYMKGWVNRRINVKQLTYRVGKKFNINSNYLLKKWLYYARRASNKNVGLEKVIKKLKKKYKVVTLTNVSEIHNVVRKEKKIYKHFHFNICSCDVGLAKPDIRIYKLLIKRLKMKPQEILFVDDVKICLVPAKKLGIKTIQFKNNKQFITDLKHFGVNLN